MKESNVLVSIIVPAFNVEKYIKKCIDSIVGQTYSNLEIIVINDGSKDSTYSIITSFSDKRIRAINQNNVGVSASRNNGLKIATGKYIVFVDGDDYLAPCFIEMFLNAAETNESDFVFSSNCITSKAETESDGSWNVIGKEKATELLLNPDIIVGCWNKLYRRKFLIDNGIWFDTSLFYGEGLRFITTVSQLANNIIISTCKQYFYRRSNENSATSVFAIEKYYNGEKSLQLIKDSLLLQNKRICSVWLYHISLFYLGGMLSLLSCGKRTEYKETYNYWRLFLKRHFLKNMFSTAVSLKRRIILSFGTLFPVLTARLNKKRKKRIAMKSVG